MFKRYNRNDFEQIVFELKNGKAAIVNTDTVYGIISLNKDLIYKIKHRPLEKKLIKFINDTKQMPYLSETQKRFLDRFWPGQVTVVINNESYRMPDNEWLLLLISKTGALYSSSANISDADVIANIDVADYTFDEKFFYDLILINDDVENKSHSNFTPSTIVNLDTWKVLRKGANYNEVKDYINHLEGKRDKKKL